MRRQAHLIAPLALALALAGCAGGPAASAPTPPVQASAPPVQASATPVQASAPPVQASATPVQASATPVQASATPVQASATPVQASAIGGEILFLRDGALIALDAATSAERSLVDGVSAFAATPDGRLLAAVRGQGARAEIWLLGRDGAGLRQLTANERAESSLSWSPDGLSLAYTAAPAPAGLAPDWQSWGEWCAAAEARVIELAGGPERTLGAGCEPAFSPDGRRIAFTTPPTSQGAGTDFPSAVNTISIVNRLGQNGWSVAKAEGSVEAEGYVVHGPTWAPDGGRLAYQRFLGYQALTDVNLTEASSSFERAGEAIGFGAGWLLTPAYAPNGAQVAVVEHNFSDARGFTGYDIWGLTVLRLGEEEELALPSATMTLQAVAADSLARATAAAWAPDGTSLVVALPAGWQPGLNDQEPIFSEQGPAELWRWRLGAPPERKLVAGVDFGSPLLWLPPPPLAGPSGLLIPQGWELGDQPGFVAVAAAPDGTGLVGLRELAPAAPRATAADLAQSLLGPDAAVGDPYTLPDGSTLREIRGAAPDGAPRAGLVRLTTGGRLTIYLADAEAWPLRRAEALALIVAGGLTP